MNHFAQKCIEDHRNPMVKINLPSQKLFLPANTEEEEMLISSHQEHLKTVLEHQRVERRGNRAQALWLPDDNIAKVTKVVKNLVRYFGFQNKNGIFLYPEEMLFLLETNRLEVRFCETTLSIEKAYDLMFKTTSLTLPKYRIYKKLALLGFKLARSHNKKGNAKRPLEDMEPHVAKRNKTEEEEKATDITKPNMSKEVERVSDILSRIREIMPVDSKTESTHSDPDYYVFSPKHIGNAEPDFHLVICEDILSNKRNYNSKNATVYAICNDDVAFYKLSNVHLPFI